MSPLNRDLEATYRLTLSDAAKELTVGESLPVDIERICAKLQVEHGRKINLYQTALLTGKSQIHLPSSLLPQSGYYSAQERYLIAHEIGHLILTSLCSATPLGKSEYWQFEDLCNTFARQLLIPETTLENLPNSIFSAQEALALSSNLARNASVPWPTAAWRVAELHEDFTLLYVTFRRTRLGPLTMKISASTLPRKQLQQKILSAEVGLGSVLKDLVGAKDSLSFCENEAQCVRIVTELPALIGLKGAFAVRSGNSGIRVAFQLKK